MPVRNRRFLKEVLAFSLMALVVTDAASAQETVSIVRPVKASFAERLAAREIRRYLYLRTGELPGIFETDRLSTGELRPVIGDQKKQPSEGSLIIVAQKDRPLVKGLTEENEGLKSSVVSVEPQQYQLKAFNIGLRRAVVIAGGDETGTLYGAYRFIEHFGVRFYLHGDTIPDKQIPFSLPDQDERGEPLFELRGIQPFHDFPEGPDWWSTDDYKAIIAQLAKLRMNFIGLHTYPEGGYGPEPTVWIGLPEDVEPDGKVKFSYVTSYANSLRGMWGYAPKKTGEYVFGASKLFERDDYGPQVMSGMVPFPKTPQQNNELFNRTGSMLKEAFEYAHALGIKTCVGTETPLMVPNAVKERIKALGKDPCDPFIVEQLYEGMFDRIVDLGRCQRSACAGDGA
jgi:hypothetical protein